METAGPSADTPLLPEARSRSNCDGGGTDPHNCNETPSGGGPSFTQPTPPNEPTSPDSSSSPITSGSQGGSTASPPLPSSTSTTESTMSPEAPALSDPDSTSSSGNINGFFSSILPPNTRSIGASSPSPPAPLVTPSSIPIISAASGHNRNVGAIAGGVVGGVVGLLIIGGLLLWWFIHRRRRRIAPSAAYTAVYGTKPPSIIQERSHSSRSTHHLQASVGNSTFEPINLKQQ